MCKLDSSINSEYERLWPLTEFIIFRLLIEYVVHFAMLKWGNGKRVMVQCRMTEGGHDTAVLYKISRIISLYQVIHEILPICVNNTL